MQECSKEFVVWPFLCFFVVCMSKRGLLGVRGSCYSNLAALKIETGNTKLVKVLIDARIALHEGGSSEGRLKHPLSLP